MDGRRKASEWQGEGCEGERDRGRGGGGGGGGPLALLVRTPIWQGGPQLSRCFKLPYPARQMVQQLLCFGIHLVSSFFCVRKPGEPNDAARRASIISDIGGRGMQSSNRDAVGVRRLSTCGCAQGRRLYSGSPAGGGICGDLSTTFAKQ